MSKGSQLVGRIVGGRYRIDELIGEGGFGLVYRGTHLDLATPVAIKITTEERPDLLARFRREARAQDRINSRFVVRLRDFGREPDGLHYLIQNFVPGRSLEEIVDFDGPLTPARAVRLTRQICFALEEAHLRGVIHRDVKPSNIMAVDTPRGEEIRLLDFGIAKMLDEGSKELGLTRTGQIYGTVAYMAPEQLQGRPPVPATDVYAVSGTLFTLLTGEYPYRGTVKSVAMQHLVAPLPTLPQECPGPILDPIIQRGMGKEPLDRFRTAGAMDRALAEVERRLVGLPARAEPETVVDSAALEQIEELDPRLLQPIDGDSRVWDETRRARISALSHHLRGQLDEARTEARWVRGHNRRQLVIGVGGAALVGVLLAIAVHGLTADPVVPPMSVRTAPTTTARPAPEAQPESVVARPIEVKPAGPVEIQVPPTRIAVEAAAPDEPSAARAPVERRKVAKKVRPKPPEFAPSLRRPRTAKPLPEATGNPPPADDGYLKLLAKPPARASIRGRDLGWTPVLKHALPPGTYTVDLKRDQSPSYRARVRVRIESGKTHFERYTHRP